MLGFNRVVCVVLNRLLQAQPHLANELADYAGNSFSLSVWWHKAIVGVNAQGVFEPLSVPALCHADLTVQPLRLVAGLMQQSAQPQGLQIAGDSAWSVALLQLLSQLDWDAEESLSQWIGDIPAHRIAQTLRLWADWQRQFVRQNAQDVVAYLQFEAATLAIPHVVALWCNEVDTLRDDVARLQKRILKYQAALVHNKENTDV